MKTRNLLAGFVVRPIQLGTNTTSDLAVATEQTRHLRRGLLVRTELRAALAIRVTRRLRRLCIADFMTEGSI